jgi:hypothetical protein
MACFGSEIRRYPRLCAFVYEYIIFLGRVTSPSAKPPFLEDLFVSLSLASLLYREQAQVQVGAFIKKATCLRVQYKEEI